MDCLTVTPGVSHSKIYAAGLRVICTLVLAGILVAGLWPFHSPPNNVKWMGEGKGLALGKYGDLLTVQPFRNAPAKPDTACSLEIWVEPARVDRSGTILAYYRPDNFVVQISLRQYKTNLVFGFGDLYYQQHVRFAGIFVPHTFHKHRSVLLSVTTGISGTAVYADGALVKRSSSFKFSSNDLAGQLMFGNSPGTTDVWSGTLRGFAVYDRELSTDEVGQHYVSWTHGSEKSLTHETGAVGVYLFSENAGSFVHNEIDPATNLLAPARFFVPHKQFLETPWHEFQPGWGYWRGVIVNVVGFIPLGFFFCALFYCTSDLRHPLPTTILLGFVVSLTIEVLQGFLPTRSSGTTDLITNTLGTALGAVGYTLPVLRYWLRRVVSPAFNEPRLANIPVSWHPIPGGDKSA